MIKISKVKQNSVVVSKFNWSYYFKSRNTFSCSPIRTQTKYPMHKDGRKNQPYIQSFIPVPGVVGLRILGFLGSWVSRLLHLPTLHLLTSNVKPDKATEIMQRTYFLEQLRKKNSTEMLNTTRGQSNSKVFVFHCPSLINLNKNSFLY